MHRTIVRLTVPTLAALALVAAGCAMTAPATADRDPEPQPVRVETLHEESGELSDVTVTTEDGEHVEVLETDESWRGNDEAEDGLYAEDPAAEEQEEVADNVDQEALEDAPETTETDDETVSAEDDSEAVTDDETVSAEDDSEAVTDDEEDAWAPDPDAINVYVEIGSNGEVTAVELTNADGDDVPVGSISESYGD